LIVVNKPPELLLIAGQLCTSSLWKDVVPKLSDVANVRIVMPQALDSIKSIASNILESAPETFSLCAHAMGGFIAFEIIRIAPQRVERLALLDTLATPDFPEQIARRHAYTKLLEQGEFLDIVQTRIPMLLHPDRVSDAPLISTILEMARDTGQDKFVIQQKAIMSRRDSRPDLGKINAVTLVLAGDADGIVSIERTRELADGIPHAKLVLIEGCGHLAPLEKPDAVSKALLQWMQS